MIDHLVLATSDVTATAGRLGNEWGVTVVAGGSHVGVGTRNELTGLGGSTYLEIVGPDAAQTPPSVARPFGVDDLTEATLVAWCARPERPLADVVGAVAALGVDLGDIAEMSRRRPDGMLLEWRLTFPLLTPEHAGTLPFLIDWCQSPHPATTLPHECELTSLRLTHDDPDLLRAVLREIGVTSIIEVSAGPPTLAAIVRTPAGELSV